MYYHNYIWYHIYRYMYHWLYLNSHADSCPHVDTLICNSRSLNRHLACAHCTSYTYIKAIRWQAWRLSTWNLVKRGQVWNYVDRAQFARLGHKCIHAHNHLQSSKWALSCWVNGWPRRHCWKLHVGKRHPSRCLEIYIIMGVSYTITTSQCQFDCQISLGIFPRGSSP